MAKLELITTFNSLYPKLVMIPGGPGLCPLSFRNLGPCLKNLNVYLYHPTGTDGEEAVGECSYEDQLENLSREVQKLGDVYLCGHSFGGIQAVDLAMRLPSLIKGLILLASPFSERSFSEVSSSFNKDKTLEQINMDEQFKSDSSNENYKKWFVSYAHMYFSTTKIVEGRKLLKESSVCVKNFLGASSEASLKGRLLNEIKSSEIKKLFIAGNEDKLLSPETLGNDADNGGFKFLTIENAGHFVHFEQPIKIAQLIEDFIFAEGER